MSQFPQHEVSVCVLLCSYGYCGSGVWERALNETQMLERGGRWHGLVSK